MKRIVLAGFFHETNTFAPAKADLAAFTQHGPFSGIKRGAEVIRHTDVNLAYAGFVNQARTCGWQIVPLASAGTQPCDRVTEEAYEHITAIILEALRAALPVDAVYLDLHGAMVAEHVEDGEGELIARVRRIVGPDLPVIVTLDFHANVSRAMVELTDALFLYRTYPHVDLAETGHRAARHLHALWNGLPKQAKALREIPYLIPPAAQSTLAEPLKAIYARAAALEGATIGNGRISTIAMAPGFALADIADCRPTVTVYADTQGAADAAAGELAALYAKHEKDFAQHLYAPHDAIVEAKRILAAPGRGPVLLADTQDNPGGGGNGDTVGLLRALLAADAPAVLAHIWDPEAALHAHEAGERARLHLALGAKTGFAGETPVEAEWTVVQLNNGETIGTGAMGKGWRFNMGKSALLRCGQVTVCVISNKGQCLDQEQLRVFGIEPSSCAILAVKSTVHFRADFAPLARGILVVRAPGPVFADHTELEYRRLRPGVRLMPLGPAYTPAV